MKRALAALAAFAATAVVPISAHAAPAAPRVSAVVVLKSQADVGALARGKARPARLAAVENGLRSHAARTQQHLRRLLDARRKAGLVDRVVPLWIANEIEVTAAPAVLRELARDPDVAAIHPDTTIQAPAAPSPAAAASSAVEPNIALVGAPAMWNRGFTGQGVVVANMDTGVDGSVPDLAGRWRGGTNSWYDPNNQHPTAPTDVNGHGTWTMGVTVGGDASGSAVGMAPGAQWIAVKIFNDRNVTSTGIIHQGFQWLLDPDGDPSTPDAPNVVNNSWSTTASGCATDFQLDLQNLRAAGILPVFAAGNSGPNAASIDSPANLPEAFAVGGTDNNDAIDPGSSRGPSACAGATAPLLTAPDTNIRTTDVLGGYVTQTGTSLAAPHVTGAIALLLSAFPGLPIGTQENALQAAAHDLGPPGLDTDFGYGRLDVDAAYQWIANTPDFALGASPSSVTAAPGTTASYSVSVTGSNGFTGDVSFSLSGLSATQASWTFTPAVVAGGAGSTALDLALAADLAPGTHPLSITGTSGTLSRTVPATLVVPAPPDFTVAVSPSSVSADPGGSATGQVSVTALNGFASDVTLSLDGLPASVGSAAFSPATIATAGTSQLTITVLGSAPAGTYALTVSASGGGQAHSAPLSLTVNSSGDFALTITPGSRTVNAGRMTAYFVHVTGLNGFADAVTLSARGITADVGTIYVMPKQVTPDGMSTVVVLTSAQAPRGSYTLTITGRSGTLVHSVQAALTVRVPSFRLSASPSSVSVLRGRTAAYAVSSTRIDGFTGPVTLSVSGVPANASAGFSIDPISADGTSTMRVRTTAGTPRGQYVLTVKGRSGTLLRTVTVRLIVT